MRGDFTDDVNSISRLNNLFLPPFPQFFEFNIFWREGGFPIHKEGYGITDSSFMGSLKSNKEEKNARHSANPAGEDREDILYIRSECVNRRFPQMCDIQ